MFFACNNCVYTCLLDQSKRICRGFLNCPWLCYCSAKPRSFPAVMHTLDGTKSPNIAICTSGAGARRKSRCCCCCCMFECLSRIHHTYIHHHLNHVILAKISLRPLSACSGRVKSECSNPSAIPSTVSTMPGPARHVMGASKWPSNVFLTTCCTLTS